MPYNGSQPGLTEEQKRFWLEHGYIKISTCFTREQSDEFTASFWTRIGADKDDKSTWPTEKINMPGHTTISCQDFAPKAYAAMCELVGGEERIDDWCKQWRDGWIPNFGRPEYCADGELDYRQLDNWHNDGDWFTHFLG